LNTVPEVREFLHQPRPLPGRGEIANTFLWIGTAVISIDFKLLAFNYLFSFNRF
jgi:hypothetical protein